MRLFGVVAIAVMVLGHTAPAFADDQPPAQPQPWAVGVTAEQKAAAQQHLDAGNALFLERKYLEALSEYDKAIAAWNHPAIRFNIVRCLIQLERPVQAAANLEQALAYGAAPFDDAIYTEALGYQKLIANQIGEIEIACAQPGVDLTLDGKPLLACPGKEVRRVLPGQHQIVGTKPGHLPQTVKLVVFGGKFERAEIALDPLEKGAKIVHRWRTWIPWSVVGGGFALAGIGGLVRWKAVSDNDTYTMLVSDNCTGGCDAQTWSRALRENAELENKVAIGVIATGAAAVVTGGVMLYLNRGRTVYEARERTITAVTATPVASGATVTVLGRF